MFVDVDMCMKCLHHYELCLHKFLFFSSQEKYSEQSEQTKRLNKLLSLVTTVSDRTEKLGLNYQDWIKNIRKRCFVSMFCHVSQCEKTKHFCAKH